MSSRRAQHEENVTRWQETTAWFIDGPGRLLKKKRSEKIVYKEDFDAQSYQEERKGDEQELEISVIPQDSFIAAIELVNQGYNPLVLNMANAQNPGGGVHKGSIAQEEDLFRRSNYFQVTNLLDFYPLGELEVLYSPTVSVYKDSNNRLLSELCILSCIACAAERDPKTVANPIDPLNPYNRLYADDKITEITKKRIDTIFQVGIQKGHDSLVLGGLGCGAFNNPQMRIIEYFNESLKRYRSSFKKIVFAVLSKKDPNFDLFSEFIDITENKNRTTKEPTNESILDAKTNSDSERINQCVINEDACYDGVIGDRALTTGQDEVLPLGPEETPANHKCSDSENIQ